MSKQQLHILAVAPYCDGTDVGEAWCAFMWVKELSKQAKVTLITQHRQGRIPLREQVPGAQVISRPEPRWATRFERLNAMAKLSYSGFYRWARKQIAALIASGECFDLGHQFSPIALRFPSPLQGFDFPYILGPQGGSLETPNAFRAECKSGAWYTRFRALDQLRLKIDPRLKRTYREAAAVIGVAPYVREKIQHLNPQRFVVESELGVHATRAPAEPKADKNSIRILHVGRGVRTKGLRDVIRALAHLKDTPGIILDVAGKGEEMSICQSLAKKLGVAERVKFHGQIPREKVDDLYRQADIFCFPSFREPSGSVVFEALSHGLPAIVADYGGPGNVVDETCGFKVPVTEPDKYASDIAGALLTLITMPALRSRLSAGALTKMNQIGIWPNKIERLIALYNEILTEKAGKEADTECLKNSRKPKSSLSHPEADTGSKCCA